METQVLIISGFLGSGKTTLIQAFLATPLKEKKVLIIENDFGQINLDSSLLKAQGYKLKELTSGCICCTLAGDFETSLVEVIEKEEADLIIIEPSGVGKLSDILPIFEKETLKNKIDLLPTVTVVDAERCELYAKNFGPFFLDQVRLGQRLVLTHGTNWPEQVEKATLLLKELNPKALIYTEASSSSFLQEVLQPLGTANSITETEHSCCHGSHGEHHHSSHEAHEEHHCCHGSHGEHHEHHNHNHNHDNDPFTTETLLLEGNRSLEEWKSYVQKLLESSSPTILRIKGVLPTPEGALLLQYNGKDFNFTACELSNYHLTIIKGDIEKCSMSADKNE